MQSNSLLRVSPAVQAQVNEAIAHLNAWLDKQTAEQIKAQYDSATYDLVAAVYRRALDYPVNWQQETYEQAIASSRAAVQATYPFLDEQSLRILGNCFAYAWR